MGDMMGTLQRQREESRDKHVPMCVCIHTPTLGNKPCKEQTPSVDTQGFRVWHKTQLCIALLAPSGEAADHPQSN